MRGSEVAGVAPLIWRGSAVARGAEGALAGGGLESGLQLELGPLAEVGRLVCQELEALTRALSLLVLA